jgi:hypothetical protein
VRSRGRLLLACGLPIHDTSLKTTFYLRSLKTTFYLRMMSEGL